MKRSINLKQPYMCVYIYYPHRNHKPKLCNRYIHKKRERNSSITLKTVIKSQGKKTKGGRGTKNYENNPQTTNKLSAPIKRQ